MEKSRYQLDIEDQLDCLKKQIAIVAEKPSEIEIIKATLAAEFVFLRVKGFCEMTTLRRDLHGMDGAAA